MINKSITLNVEGLSIEELNNISRAIESGKEIIIRARLLTTRIETDRDIIGRNGCGDFGYEYKHSFEAVSTGKFGFSIEEVTKKEIELL
jgi:hypothetical protein